jgi:hypothetical protein
MGAYLSKVSILEAPELDFIPLTDTKVAQSDKIYAPNHWEN